MKTSRKYAGNVSANHKDVWHFGGIIYHLSLPDENDISVVRGLVMKKVKVQEK